MEKQILPLGGRSAKTLWPFLLYVASLGVVLGSKDIKQLAQSPMTSE